MAVKKVFNFYAGPANLPKEVLLKAQEELLNFDNTGISIMETSHRSKEFTRVIEEAENKIRKIMSFLHGGASLQFAMVPLNFIQNKKADYVYTGRWALMAIKEAKLLGEVHIAGSSEDKNFTYIPKNLDISPDTQYIHITTNETVNGVQWDEIPDTGDIPLIADMSSDIMSRKIDVTKFGLIYAGAQKNIGISGVCVVIIKKELAEKGNPNLPTMLKYTTHIEKKSLHNTPSTIGIYMINLVMDWVLKKGGIDEIEKINNKKAQLLYDYIDSTDFYENNVEKQYRSKMNVVFFIKNKELESKFIEEATENNLIGLKGHRSLGGLRASIYNAMPIEGVENLIDFMKEFEKKYG